MRAARVHYAKHLERKLGRSQARKGFHRSIALPADWFAIALPWLLVVLPIDRSMTAASQQRAVRHTLSLGSGIGGEMCGWRSVASAQSNPFLAGVKLGHLLPCGCHKSGLSPFLANNYRKYAMICHQNYRLQTGCSRAEQGDTIEAAIGATDHDVMPYNEASVGRRGVQCTADAAACGDIYRGLSN